MMQDHYVMTDIPDETQQPYSDTAPSDADSPAEIEAEREAQFALQEYFARLRALTCSSPETADNPHREGDASPCHELEV
jgi:hypothetical protein